MLYNQLHNTYVSDLFTFPPNNYLTRGHQFKLYLSTHQEQMLGKICLVPK